MSGEGNDSPAFDLGYEVDVRGPWDQKLDSAASALDTLHNILSTAVKQKIAYAQIGKNTIDHVIRTAAQQKLGEVQGAKATLDNVLQQSVGNRVASAWENASTLGIVPSFGDGVHEASAGSGQGTQPDMSLGGIHQPEIQGFYNPISGQTQTTRPLSSPTQQPVGIQQAQSNWWVEANLDTLGLEILDRNDPTWRHVIASGHYVPIRVDFGSNLDVVDYWLANHDNATCALIAKYAVDNRGLGWPVNGDFTLVDVAGNIVPGNPVDNQHGFPVGGWPFDVNNNWVG